MFLTRLTTRELIKLNCQRLSKRFTHENKVLNLTRHSVNFFPKGITFRKYSTETEALGVKDKKYNDCVEDAENDKEMKKDREKIFEELANGDPEILKKLKLIEFEIAVLKEQGKPVVHNPKKSQWEELLDNFNAPFTQRMKLLSFMGLNEKLEFYNLKKKNIKLMMRKKKKEAGFHYYGFTGHSMIPLLMDNGQMFYKILALRQMMAKSKIVIDCSYDEFMSKVNQKNLAKQIHMCIGQVQKHRYPCQLVFSNLDQNTHFGKLIQKYIQNIFNENFHCEVSSQNVTDIYPKEKIVYLSPDSPNNLVEVNEDDIYVIGGYVDKGTSVKASLAKAKKEKLRVAKLPIDLYMFWRQGSKNLPINIVLQVLMDMMFYKDWNFALKSISSKSTNDIFRRRNLSQEKDELEDTLEFEYYQ